MLAADPLTQFFVVLLHRFPFAADLHRFLLHFDCILLLEVKVCRSFLHLGQLFFDGIELVHLGLCQLGLTHDLLPDVVHVCTEPVERSCNMFAKNIVVKNYFALIPLSFTIFELLTPLFRRGCAIWSRFV